MKCGILVCICLVVFCGFCMAMSNKDPSDIPAPVENFNAIITDIDDVVTEGCQISFDGQTYLTAQRGATDVFIPFEKILKITASNNESVITEESIRLSVEITLRNGNTEYLTVLSRDQITGLASFGPFRLRMDHFRSIEFSKGKITDTTD